MFKDLTNFKLRRNTTQAIGFYIAYFVVTLIIGVTVALVLGMASGHLNDVAFSYRIGNLSAVAVSMVLAFLILSRKKLVNNIGWLLVALSSGILAFYGGALLGLIPAAVLSTKK